MLVCEASGSKCSPLPPVLMDMPLNTCTKHFCSRNWCHPYVAARMLSEVIAKRDWANKYLWRRGSMKRLQWGKLLLEYLRTTLVYFGEKTWIWISIFLGGDNVFNDITANPVLCARWWQLLDHFRHGRNDAELWVQNLPAEIRRKERGIVFLALCGWAWVLWAMQSRGRRPAPCRPHREHAGAHEVQGDILSFPSGFEYMAKRSSEIQPA